VVLLKPLDDADMGQTEGAAAFESQADDAAVGRDDVGQERWLRRGDCGGSGASLLLGRGSGRQDGGG
jgi:hypothetical protein